MIFTNMDRFASDCVESRIEQRDPITRLPQVGLRLGSVVFVDGEDWTIFDFDYDTQSVHLCRGKRFNFVQIEELV